MAIWSKLISPIERILTSALDKIAPDKLDEETRIRLQIEMANALREHDETMERTFRDWVIEYEGAAKDMPRFIQIMRGLVRPLITYLLTGATVYGFYYGLPEEAMVMLYRLDLVAILFWFGEKIVTRSGLSQVLPGIVGNGKQGEGQ